MQRIRLAEANGAVIDVVLRRARRTDFPAVMRLLAHNEVALPPADRSTLRRFRNIINDLGSDIYVCLTDDEALVGLLHLTYSRQLCETATARIEMLMASGPHAATIRAALANLAETRARKRGCQRLAEQTMAPALDEANPLVATA